MIKLSKNTTAIYHGMIKSLMAIIALCVLSSGTNSLAQNNNKLTDYVDPFIGTGGHGHTYPGVSLPFGMVQLSPDTDTQGWDWCSGYHYSDSTIMGFSHIHLSGTGIGDYGEILFMPGTGDVKLNPGPKDAPDAGYRSRFSHDNEIARPGYYSVFLEDYSINAELTATKRTGFHKYTFPECEQSFILIDLVHGIQDKTVEASLEVLDNKTIRGSRRSRGWAADHTVYFYASFSKPFKTFAITDSGKVLAGVNKASGREVKAYVQYTTADNEDVLVKVGISHTSLEGAEKNLKSEIPGWDFEHIAAGAASEWENELSKVTVESNNEKNKKIFYTALYHSVLNPNTFSDVDGSYTRMDGKIGQADDGDIYTVFSLWDTFRAAHPLFTLIDPDRVNDMIRTMIAKYEEGGLLPVWELAANETETMIGYHSIPVIADAYFKGIRDYDVDKAFEAMKNSAMQDRHGLKYYKQMGYIPAELESEAVSKTLEYSYDDWCIAQMAKDLGREEDYKYFITRAQYYANQFDPETKLMRPKKNGKWFEPFDPYSVSGDYTEANAWQYSFFVPQDVNGLIDLCGGDKAFIDNLDQLFTASGDLTGRHQSDITGLIGQYAHGNEPSHHMAYLYNYAGMPSRTQEIVHEILSTLYTANPDGLSGNEDCGQMSAWYVLSAAGIYPVRPGDGTYIIGTSNFNKTVFNQGRENAFTIVANNLSDENYYIKSATLNGKDYPYSYIKHADIMAGGELVFEMSSKPGSWGTSEESRPVSSIDAPFVTVPYLERGERVFRDSTIISIASIDKKTKVFSSTDGSDPREKNNLYEKPIVLKKSGTVKYVGWEDSLLSETVTSVFNKIPEGRTIKLSTEYSSKYTGGGALGLIDGIKGTTNFHTPAWQGYEGNDLEALIDLGKVQNIETITATFLQDIRSWIFYPLSIEYYVSSDGNSFTKIYEIENLVSESNNESGIKEFSAILKNTEARFIKVLAKNVGVCPDWHLGAGGKSWIFIDEISIY